eukprot:281034-Pelagomonas_calceolata.AAC.5
MCIRGSMLISLQHRLLSSLLLSAFLKAIPTHSPPTFYSCLPKPLCAGRSLAIQTHVQAYCLLPPHLSSPAVSLTCGQGLSGLCHGSGDGRGQGLCGVSDAQADDLSIGVAFLVRLAAARDLQVRECACVAAATGQIRHASLLGVGNTNSWWTGSRAYGIQVWLHERIDNIKALSKMQVSVSCVLMNCASQSHEQQQGHVGIISVKNKAYAPSIQDAESSTVKTTVLKVPQYACHEQELATSKRTAQGTRTSGNRYPARSLAKLALRSTFTVPVESERWRGRVQYKTGIRACAWHSLRPGGSNNGPTMGHHHQCSSYMQAA